MTYWHKKGCVATRILNKLRAHTFSTTFHSLCTSANYVHENGREKHKRERERERESERESEKAFGEARTNGTRENQHKREPETEQFEKKDKN